MELDKHATVPGIEPAKVVEILRKAAANLRSEEVPFNGMLGTTEYKDAKVSLYELQGSYYVALTTSNGLVEHYCFNGRGRYVTGLWCPPVKQAADLLGFLEKLPDDAGEKAFLERALGSEDKN